MKTANSNRNIAILGSTSHIAKGLIAGFLGSGYTGLSLFARAPEAVRSFVSLLGEVPGVAVRPFSEFAGGAYDVVINCVGIGDPGKLRQEMSAVFGITETFDNLVLRYLEGHPAALYLNLSSGAAYGQDFSQPVSERSLASYDINHLSPGDFYGMAKACCEAKHRSLSGLQIVDLRIFGYFSRFIDLGTRYLMSEVVTCLKTGEPLVTGRGDIVRDYVHPTDLFCLVENCIARREINDVYDVYSLKPVGKFEMLEHFSARFGLKFCIEDDAVQVAPTGNKDHYYSLNQRALQIGYAPRVGSLACLVQETAALLA